MVLMINVLLDNCHANYIDSGHGGQTKDLDGDEDDGYDEGSILSFSSLDLLLPAVIEHGPLVYLTLSAHSDLPSRLRNERTHRRRSHARHYGQTFTSWLSNDRHFRCKFSCGFVWS
jgi:hypothetical protein